MFERVFVFEYALGNSRNKISWWYDYRYLFFNTNTVCSKYFKSIYVRKNWFYSLTSSVRSIVYSAFFFSYSLFLRAFWQKKKKSFQFRFSFDTTFHVYGVFANDKAIIVQPLGYRFGCWFVFSLVLFHHFLVASAFMLAHPQVLWSSMLKV